LDDVCSYIFSLGQFSLELLPLIFLKTHIYCHFSIASWLKFMKLEIKMKQHTAMMPVNFFLDLVIFIRLSALDLLINPCLQPFLCN